MPSHTLWLRLAYLTLLVVAVSFLAAGVGESLWLDELHTSWSISGNWGEIAERARAGNQSPLYFWIVAALSQTLGGFLQRPGSVAANISGLAWQEIGLRLPSIVSWLACVVLLGRYLNDVCRSRRLNRLLVPGLLLWLVFDRIQWFYATEARPYAMLQFVSLAGWGCVAAIFIRNPSPDGAQASSPRTRRGWIVAWTLLAILSLYLHLTAGLSVLTQWLAGGLLWLLERWPSGRESSPTATFRMAPQVGRMWLLASALVAVACLPLLQIAAPVWHKRELWAGFASDVSPLALVTLFPLLPILLPVLVAKLVDGLVSIHRDSPTAEEAAVTRATWRLQLMCWLALLGPWLLAWVITATGVAPLFHRRFVIASAIPLVMVAAQQLLSIPSARLRWLTLAVVVAALIFTQGTAQPWRRGQLVGWLRGEDWRAAARWLSDQLAADEAVYCASGLIEGNSLEPPLDMDVAQYLAFPLTGAYDVTVKGARVPINALVNDARLWGKQLFCRTSSQPISLASQWVVYRGAPARLQSKLRVLEDSLGGRRMLVEEQRSFGAVQVIKLKLGAIP